MPPPISPLPPMPQMRNPNRPSQVPGPQLGAQNQMPDVEEAAMRLLQMLNTEHAQAGMSDEPTGMALGRAGADASIFPAASRGTPVPMQDLPNYIDFVRQSAAAGPGNPSGAPLPPMGPQAMGSVKQDMSTVRGPLQGMPAPSAEELSSMPTPMQLSMQNSQTASDQMSAELAMDSARAAKEQAMQQLLQETMQKPDMGPKPGLSDIMNSLRPGR